MPHTDLEKKILKHVQGKNYRPVKPRIIAKNLGLVDNAAREMKRAIKKLVSRGELAYGDKHLVTLPTAGDSSRVVGIYRRREAGYGFVRPQHAKPSDGRDQDIYIAAKSAGDAASGDTVLVRLYKKRPHQRDRGPSGEIVEILERETHRFVGTYFEQSGLGLVQIDGQLFTRPVLVGDPTASGANVNDKVVLEMVRFPSHVHDGEAVIVEVLGPRGTPGVDTLTVIHEFGLPGEFGDDVLAEAREQAEQFDDTIPDERTDLTGETVITIDPADARDFDDAISLIELENGHWQLGVHIADVSRFVPQRTALDREARDRATSVYLPDRVIPMLPEIVSNNLASLQPRKVRYTLSAMIEFTADGAPVDLDLHVAAIKSSRRFTYEEVDDYLADPAAWRKKLPTKVHSLLGRMHRLAMILRKRRFERGSLELALPEVKIDLDKQGRVVGAHRVEHTESHQIIEEFMLAANEAVAAWLVQAELSFLRRMHGSPDPRKLHALTEFVIELGFRTESLESRFALQELLQQADGMPTEHAVNFAVLRAMQKAVYSPEEEGHYALASECYCHFTSPIRRYPDLTVHRLVKDVLAGRPPIQEIGELFSLGDHCSRREQRAEEAEHELTRIKLLSYLGERIGQEMGGIVTGVTEFGLFVQGAEIPAEGFVHVSSLADDYYNYDSAGHLLSGYRSKNCYRLGDAVRVAVARVDIDRRELDFRVVAKLDHPSKPRRQKFSPPQKTSARKAGKNKPVKKKSTTQRKPTKKTSKKRTAKKKSSTKTKRRR